VNGEYLFIRQTLGLRRDPPMGERVTIEALCRHLVRECEIGPVSPNWETVVNEAEASFEEIQRRRVGA